MNFKRHHNKMQFVLIACYLANFLDRIQAQHVDDDARAFVKPNIDYSPWSPVDIIDYPLEIKISKVRSILSSPPETANINRNNKFSPANLKTATRRNFESASNGEIESPPSSSIRPTYRRKIFSTSTSSPSSTIKTENAAGRFRVNRRPIESHQGASTTAKPRRQFTPRTTSENVVAATTPENSSSTTKRVTFKKPTRGTYRPKTTSKSNANDDGNDGENYPEHFKALLKNKEVITQQNDKSVLKKPSKVFRPTSADKPTKVPVKTKPNAALYSPRPRQLKSTTILSTEASTTEAVITKRPSLRTRPPYRPTERAKLNFGSTLQEPPTAKTTPTYTTRAQVKQIVEEESMNVNTQITDDAVKQIDPPINEQYFPRTSAIGSSAGLRFSSRFRNSDVTLKPGYQPTVPIVTTTPGPGLDLNEIDLERWREILPLAAELIHGDAEIMTQSPSQTVSIYEALAEILSKPTESLNLFNNKSTDRTLISEAPISSTTSSTTTTTSTSTEKFDDTKVARVNKSDDTPVYIQTNISHSLNFPNSHDTTTTLNSSDLIMSFDESTNYLIWSNIFDTNNETNGTHDMTRHPNKLDFMTRRVLKDMEMTSSSVYPVYVPKKIDITTEMTSSSKYIKNNSIEKKIQAREDMRKFDMKMTSLNPHRKSQERATTEKNKTENSGIIIDLLQKYQNETDSLVKSPNIFSLAKKGHHGESQNDTEINQLNEQHEATQRPSTSKLPSTHSSVGLNSVSIFPNGYDTTSMRPETTKDSFENEIGLDDFDFKLPTTKFTTRISTSVSSSTRSLPVTAKSTPSTTQRPTTSIKTTSQPKISSTTSFIRSTTQNFIDNNFKKLQDLLSKQTEATTTQRETTTQDITTTEIPTTTQNIINKNFQALQELLSKQTKPTAFTRNQVTTTTQIPTTQNFIDKNAKILQELLSKSQTKFETTTVPTTQNYVDRNAKILQELLLNQTKPTAFSRPSTTGVPKTTRKFIDENAKILQELLSKSYTTTDGPQTTRNYVDRNAKILQELLLNQTKPTAFSRPLPRSTTEIPETTTNFIDENAKILQELLSKNRATPFSRSTTVNQATTTEIATTTEFEELVLSTLGFSSSTTKPTSSIQKIRRPSMQTRFTTVSFKPSSTTQRVTTTEKVTTELPTTTEKTLPRTPSSTIRIIPSTTQMPTVKTSTFATPSSTHRFVPIMIPDDFSTTLFTSTTKKKSPFSDSEDLEFLRQLSSFVNRGVPTTPMTPRRTTSSTTTTTTTTTTEKTTTKKLPTTFSDSEDLAFLNSLRNYAGFINLTTERSNLANKILELAVNRMSKSVGDSKSSSNNNLESIRPAPFATTQSPEIVMNKIMDMKENINLMSSVILENQKANPQMRLSAQEVEKTKKMLQKDVMQYNNDIQLLSLLIGRPLNAQDLEKLAKTNLGKASTKAPLTSTPKLTTTTTRISSPTMRQTTSSSSTVPAFKSLSLDEVKFLQALQQIQTTLPASTTTTQSPIQTRSRSQEAIIAALLKQQGIGPSINGNNQVQLDKILDQLSTDRSNRGISDFTSTIRPFSPMPPLSRQPRPIVDGLAWLWRTWQETAPGFQAPRQRPQVQVQQQQSLSFDDEFENDQESSGNSGGGLVFPNSQPLGPNGLIGAAIGVTRAVTQFLGVAFQGAGRFLTAALTTGSAASNIQGFGDSRL